MKHLGPLALFAALTIAWTWPLSLHLGNAIPGDPEKPVITSGVRLGTPAGTTRGFGVAEFKEIAGMIVEVVESVGAKGEEGDAAVEARIRERARALCHRFPIYNA